MKHCSYVRDRVDARCRRWDHCLLVAWIESLRRIATCSAFERCVVSGWARKTENFEPFRAAGRVQRPASDER